MRRGRAIGWVVTLWLGVACAGTSCSPDAGDAGDAWALEAWDEAWAEGAGEVPGEVAPDTSPEVPEPTELLFERGLIVPEDAIPCLDWDTGEVLAGCNHHGSSVAVTADGTVLALWYHGQGEKSKDSRILWARRPPGGDWLPWEVLYDDPGKAEGNPVIWVSEADEWLVFFVTIEGEAWGDAVIRLIRSSDRGGSWSAPVTLRQAWGGMTRNKPVRLSDGTLLLPAYDENWYAPSFLRSSDDFRADWQEVWPEGADLLAHLHMIQPTLVPRADGTVFALLRNTNEVVEQRAWEMESADGGLSWGAGRPSVVPNHSASLEMVPLGGGAIALTFNNSTTGRFPLSAALSGDEGRTWSAVADLIDECPGAGCSYAYPSLAQDPTDGSLWITYTHDRRTIGWVHTNAPWIRAKGGAFAP